MRKKNEAVSGANKKTKGVNQATLVNSTLKKMVDLCVRIKRPDLVEKFTNWFLKLQKNIQDKEKISERNCGCCQRF